LIGIKYKIMAKHIAVINPTGPGEAYPGLRGGDEMEDYT